MKNPWSMLSNLILKPLRCFCGKDKRAEEQLKVEQKFCFFRYKSKEKLKSVGPWGGNKGMEWRFNEYGSAIIKQIVVVHGDGIDSLVFNHQDDGKVMSSSKFGGPGGLHTEKLDLDWPREYIISISGYYGSMWWGGPIVVRSLTFITNVTTYGPFGREEGSYFELTTQSGMIVGFFGRCGQFLDAIGIYVKPYKSDSRK